MSIAAAILSAQKTKQAALEQAMPAFGNPTSFTLAGTPYAAAIVRSGVRKTFDEHGHSQQIETLRIDVRKAVLATRPADSAVVTCGGVEWFLDADQPQVDGGHTWIMRYKRFV